VKNLAGSPRRDELSDVLQAVRFRRAIFCRSELTAPWGFSVLGRDFATFHLVTRGKCCLDVDGVDGRLWLSAGDLVILPLGNAHVVRDSPSSTATRLEELIAEGSTKANGTVRSGGGGKPSTLVCGGFHFDDRRTNPVLAGLPPVIHLRGHTHGVETWLRMALTFLAKEAHADRPGADTVVTRLADILFIQAIRTYVSAPDAQKLRLAVALRDSRIGAALAAIHRQPEEDWGVARLAKHVGMSRTAFATRFRELVGESPYFYVTRCRMNKAIHLLLSSNATVSQIARRVGYRSEVGFGRAFKQYVGTSPAAHRKRAATARRLPSA
jgi:AraC family transcriptional regulator, alkane utilization regulator